jgi:hypothetical protein
VEGNAKWSHGDGRIAARDPKKGSGSLPGYAGFALKFRWLRKKSICGVPLHLRRCTAPESALHSSVFARLASGAFYEVIINEFGVFILFRYDLDFFSAISAFSAV